MRIYFPAVLVATLAATTAQAQAPSLDPGTRVRVWAPELGIEKQPGTFEALRGDTLVVTVDSIILCPMTLVTRLDAYDGRTGHARTGAFIGMGAGAVIGAVTAVIICENAWCTVDGGVVMAGLGVGVLTGGLLGAGVGALIKTDRWVRVSVAPRRQGVAVAAAVRF